MFQNFVTHQTTYTSFCNITNVLNATFSYLFRHIMRHTNGRFLKFSKNLPKKISIINISTTTRTRGTNYSAFERSDIGLSFWSGEPPSPFRILVSFSGTAASRQFRTSCGVVGYFPIYAHKKYKNNIKKTKII